MFSAASRLYPQMPQQGPFPSLAHSGLPTRSSSSLKRPEPSVQAIRPCGTAHGCDAPTPAVHAVALAGSGPAGGCTLRDHQLPHAPGRACRGRLGQRTGRRVGQRGRRRRDPPRPALWAAQLAGGRAQRRQAQPARGAPRPVIAQPGDAAGSTARRRQRRPGGHSRRGAPV